MCVLFHNSDNFRTRWPALQVISRWGVPLPPKKLAESFRCSLCAVLLQRAHMEYLRPKEAAKRLGISRNTLNRYLAKGLIRCSRPSLRCTLISTAELARFYSATAQPVPVSVVRAA